MERLNNAGKAVLLSFPILMLIMASGCVQQNAQTVQGTPAIEITKLATDKDTYGSHEEMVVSVFARSAKSLGNVTVKVLGIKPYSHAYIDDSRTVDLAAGENEISFSVKTPYCTSGCGGVYPGPYDINAEMIMDGEVAANSSITINLIGD